MSCQEKIQKYEELKRLFQEFQENFTQAKETGKVPKDFWQLKKEIEKRREKLMELVEEYIVYEVDISKFDEVCPPKH